MAALKPNSGMTDLGNFTGTEHWYRHPLMSSITYTDGAKYVADEGGAHWLLDKIATLQLVPKVKAEEFQVWNLKVANDKAELVCGDGNNNVVYQEKIEFTDFPEPGITLWYTDHVILLPSEY